VCNFVVDAYYLICCLCGWKTIREKPDRQVIVEEKIIRTIGSIGGKLKLDTPIIIEV
jgi:hypothetical protein